MIATPEQYAEMIDRAKARGFAYPAVNVTSTQTLNAALRGFTEADSHGIVQISIGGAEYFSGASIGDAATGAVAFAEVAHVLAANHPGLVGLHTDHCPPGPVENFLRPLVVASQRRVANGGEPLFQSHMWDGSSLPLEENLRLAAELLEECPGPDRLGARDRRCRRRGGRHCRRHGRPPLFDGRGRAAGSRCAGPL